MSFGLLLLLLIPSLALLRTQYRTYKKQFQAEKRVVQALADIERKRAELERGLKEKSGHAPVLATVLGGSGAEFQKDELALISCGKDCIVFSNPTTMAEKTINFDDIVNLDISGPGTEHTNAGMVGGGFGIEGALKGILVASAINKITAKSTTNTFLRISTARAERHFHITTLEPKELRMVFSPAIVHIEAARHWPKASGPDTVSDEITKLHRLVQTGVLTNDEFSAAKARLLNHP